MYCDLDSTLNRIQKKKKKKETERANEQAESQEPRSTAASFNDQVLRKLKNAFIANPETNLISLFPNEYSERLAKRKEQETSEYLCLRRILL